jgi:hypothetical protein
MWASERPQVADGFGHGCGRLEAQAESGTRKWLPTQAEHARRLRQLGKCGNDESYLVETDTFQSNLRVGAPEKPKFEQDLLESHSSFNHREKNPEVLSRLSRQAGVIRVSI